MCIFVSCRLCRLCKLQMFSGTIRSFFSAVHLTHRAWWWADFMCRLCVGSFEHQCCCWQWTWLCAHFLLLLGNCDQFLGHRFKPEWVLLKAFSWFLFCVLSRLLSYLKRGWDLIFCFVLIQMLAEIVLKAHVVLACEILKGRFSRLRSPSSAKGENES